MPSSQPNRPRRKAKQDRARATVDVVLEAAARVVLDQGYASATTNRIAEVAGVSVGTLYEYFANKEQVLDALIRRELAALTHAISSQELDPAAPIDEKLSQLIAAAMSAVRFGPELFRSLEQVPGASFRRHLADARRIAIARVCDMLERHRGQLRVADANLAAFMVVSTVEGVGGNATAEMFDQRLVGELAAMLKAYLTGADARG